MNSSEFSVEKFSAHLSNVRAENTRIKYVDAANHFLNFLREKQLPFDRLPPQTMGNFVAWLMAKNLAPRSVHVYKAGASYYLRWCEGHGLTTPNLHADTPRPDAPVPNALRGEAILAYLRAASKLSEPFRTALLLLPYTGLRSNELATLTLSKSLRKVALPVRGSDRHQDHLVFIVRGKGGVVRVVPVLLDGAPILLSYLKNWRQHVHGDSDWLFPSAQNGPDGEPAHISTRTMRHYCAEIRKTVPTPGKLTPHTLRDTYATALWKNGVDVATMTKVLGHKDISTTYAHYLDVQDSDVLGAIVQRDARLVLQSPAAERAAGAVAFLRNTTPRCVS